MIAGLLKKIFGDKTSQDRKEYQPIIDQSNQFFEQFKNISDDELRAKTFGFQAKIKEATKELDEQIVALKEKANGNEISVLDKEDLFDEIDKLTKDIDVVIEDVLKEILPEAFAVVKETSRRWAENGQLSVTALDFDKKLATQKDGITIDGEKAIWHNEWTAAGSLRCSIDGRSCSSPRKYC
jgi:preprotein translocase subunit SecA